jgi:hypothetical protein
MAEKKSGFVSGEFLPTKKKEEIAGQPLNIVSIKTIEVDTQTPAGVRPVRVYETKDFSFFGSSIMDKAAEGDLLGKTVKVVKVKNYWAFADVKQ